MKISEMSNDMAMDAMVRISGVIGFILDDTEVKQLFTDMGNDEGKGLTVFDSVSKYLKRIVTIAAQRHRDSLYEIVGALEQKDAKEVGGMNFKQTLAMIRENWSELQDFFTPTDALTETTDK